MDKSENRHNYELIAKPGVTDAANWVTWFRAKKLALETKPKY